MQSATWLLFGAVLYSPAQPIITSQPADQTILEGETVTFSVEATGDGPLRYEWLEHMTPNWFTMLSNRHEATLVLTDFHHTFNRFAVVVQDNNGAVTSRFARVHFRLWFSQSPRSQSVPQGETAIFGAIPGGDTNFTFQWAFNGLLLPGETRTNLVLPNVQPEDSGPYSAVISNYLGSSTSKVGVLSVIRSTNFPIAARSFMNFETAPVHPIALSPNSNRLAVCNLPDHRLEIFDVRSGFPITIGSVPVGLDPVSVRFRTSNEVWVVNQISDSVSVVDVDSLRVLATLPTSDAPADVAFAGVPGRAFVSCSMENTIMVFDPLTRQPLDRILIDGERPRAMAVSPDGRRVYVAIFESGNASTILAPIYGDILLDPRPGVLESTNGPYAGMNPPPNSGTNFNPAINTNLPPEAQLPRLGHIVKKNPAGRWVDDNGRDWTEFVTGSNAPLSGRIVGWDMPDRDVAIIDSATLAVDYLTRLMTMCMDIAVNPASGDVTVIGTDASNEIRFEPNLNGVFLRVNFARVNPGTREKAILDLNPHLDYVTRTLPETERRLSIGDPRGIVWHSRGDRAYITGMGSGNLIVVDAQGRRMRSDAAKLEDGACGLVLDEGRNRLYVLNRFAASISILNAESLERLGRVALFDPTPARVKAGRKFFYDTHRTSGLGHVACASCHPDGRMDRLAWDLGDPAGDAVRVETGRETVPTFHPMKGPMVTQTMQDIIDHEPLHWRGDRASIEQFNQTFTNLQAAAQQLTDEEMQDFRAFLSTIAFPPNRYRNFDNTLATNIPLPGHWASGSNVLSAGAPLPDGDARRGLDLYSNGFSATLSDCARCHRLPAGLGTNRRIPGGLSDPIIPPGTNGEQHVELFFLRRNRNFPFKIVHLRNLPDKVGMDMSSTTSRAGFGFSFNGRVDTLTQFIDAGFSSGSDQRTADLIALLLSFAGSDFPTNNSNFPIGLSSHDAPAAVGKQLTVTAPAAPPRLAEMLILAYNRAARVDLVADGWVGQTPRRWWYDRSIDRFQSDSEPRRDSLEALLALATPDMPMTFMMVSRGTGKRMAIDRDEDGFYDRDESEFGSDPSNPSSIPLRVLAEILESGQNVRISWNTVPGRTYHVEFKTNLADAAWSGLSSNAPGPFIIDPLASNTQRFYRVQLLPP